MKGDDKPPWNRVLETTVILLRNRSNGEERFFGGKNLNLSQKINPNEKGCSVII